MESPVGNVAVAQQGGNGIATAAEATLDNGQNVEHKDRELRKLLSLEVSLARNLSSPNNGTRRKALALLGDWLPSCKQIDEADLTRIWQGILNCVWQADKVAVADLSRRVALCLGSLSPEIAVAAFRVVLSTMVREWSGIDRKRVDKYRGFFRVCLNQTLRVIQLHGWDKDYVAKFAEAFQESSAFDNTSHLLNVFLAGSFVDALREITPCSADILQMLLEPIFAVLSASSIDKLVLKKFRDAVFLPLLREAQAARIDLGEACLGSLVLSLPLSEKFHELAVSPSLPIVSKKFLNQLHEDFNWTKTPSAEDNNSRRVLKQVTAALKRRIDEADAGVRMSSDSERVPEEEQLTDGCEVPATEEESPQQQQADLPVTRSKRKRVDANGPRPRFERRVLRSGHSFDSSETSCELEADEVQVNREAVDDPVVLNLREEECSTSSSSGAVPSSPRPKRKRNSSEAEQEDTSSDKEPGSDAEGDDSDESEGTPSSNNKRVRFSLRNNIVWTPHRPLPPQWVRIPPCAAPKGSAMKPGVLPGPIQEALPKKKRKKSAKKSGKSKKSSKKQQRRNSV